MSEQIIEIPRPAIDDVLDRAGIRAVLYEVPESACVQIADLTEGQRALFDYKAVWASAELASSDFDRFWDVIGQEARAVGRFADFVKAVRLAVVSETEPGRTAITFRGFQWDAARPARGLVVPAARSLTGAGGY